MESPFQRVHPAYSSITGLQGWITTQWYSYVEQIDREGAEEKIHISLTRFNPAEKVVRKCVTAPVGTIKYRTQRIELFKELSHHCPEGT